MDIRLSAQAGISGYGHALFSISETSFLRSHVGTGQEVTIWEEVLRSNHRYGVGL